MRNVDKRGEEVLSSLISAFVDTGKAVGSATLAGHMGSRVSSATIRNVMGDLEEMGLLTHRHTSGGRVPTDKGFRYYVDRLLKVEPLSRKKVSDIKLKYADSSYTVANIFKKTSGILSKLSSYAGLVIAPLMAEMVVKHMEFIPLSRNRILGIFVGADGLVENRIIKAEGEFTYSYLEKINNYCNRAFYGLTLSEAKNKIDKEMEAAQKEYDELINRALLLSQKLFLDVEKAELFVDGESQLLCMPEFSDFTRAVPLMDMLEEKKRLIDILNNAMESDRVNIFIGSESGYDAMSDCSVVAASYKKEGRVLGTLGVIGPMRMDYSKVVPIVDCTASLIGDFLGGEDMYDQ